MSASRMRHCWLMKAEPDSRTVKGIDVAFSSHHFERCIDQTTSWEGVRNAEASKMMRVEMHTGDDVLFYHSNCKLPGIAALAKVVREGYPDFTAWDQSHPYFDAKTDKGKPKWFMVDVQLQRTLPTLVPLALLQYLASSSHSHSLPYLTQRHLEAISSMQLLNRGRLSVQRVEPTAFEAISLLGDRGGWQDWPGKWNTRKVQREPAAPTAPTADKPRKDEARPEGRKRQDGGQDGEESGMRRSKRVRGGQMKGLGQV